METNRQEETLRGAGFEEAPPLVGLVAGRQGDRVQVEAHARPDRRRPAADALGQRRGRRLVGEDDELDGRAGAAAQRQRRLHHHQRLVDAVAAHDGRDGDLVRSVASGRAVSSAAGRLRIAAAAAADRSGSGRRRQPTRQVQAGPGHMARRRQFRWTWSRVQFRFPRGKASIL